MSDSDMTKPHSTHPSPISEGDKLSDERLDKLISAYGKMSFERAYGELASGLRELKAFRALSRCGRDEALIADAWQELLDKDDRTSPEEYPEMVLITRDELAEFMARSLVSDDKERGSAAGAAPFAGRQSLPAALQDWLIEIEEYLQDRHDIRDGAPGGPHPLPNEEMSLTSALRCALGEEP